MKRAVLLPWSGGMDSTTLLIQLLTEGKFDHVYTSYIELDGNNDKIACEKNTIEVLTNHICSNAWQPDTSGVKWTHGTYKFADFPPCNPSEGMIQPAIWMMYAALEAGAIAQEYDKVEVNIGYVRGDSALKYKDKVMATWNGISGLTRLDTTPYPLKFPFAGMSKNHVQARLEKYGKKYDTDFLDAVWVCEEPIRFSDLTGSGYKRCGECHPCKRDPRYTEIKVDK